MKKKNGGVLVEVGNHGLKSPRCTGKKKMEGSYTLYTMITEKNDNINKNICIMLSLWIKRQEGIKK